MQLFTVSGWVVFGLAEGETTEQVNTAEVGTFFGSLKFTDKAKDVFARVKR